LISAQVDTTGLSADSSELRIAALLDQYRALREERLAGESRRTQSASGLLIIGLQQRLFSSIGAFAKTLAVRFGHTYGSFVAVAILKIQPRHTIRF
jgi:hypothetical protein